MKKSLNIMIFLIINFSLINVIINSIFSNYKLMHPVNMGMMLLLFNIYNSINLSIYNNNSWFSFISFLIIVSGLMIMFLYFSSFIMNMNSSLNYNFSIHLSIKILIIYIMMMFMILSFKKFMIWYNNSSDNLKFINSINLNNKLIMYMYMFNKNFSTIISILYLLLSLTLIINMIMNNKYMLRKINNYEKINFKIS